MFHWIYGKRLGLSEAGLMVDGTLIASNYQQGSGKVFYVDPANGDDNRSGLSPDEPLDTVSAALALCTAGKNDTVVLIGDGSTTGTSRDTATIAWSKNATHLVGVCAPAMISQRARISPPTAAAAIVTPQMKVTGSGCIFANVSLFEGNAENGVASVGIEVEAAHRNWFYNVAIMNLGDAVTGNSGDEAGSAHLLLDGAQENLFEQCYIGLDTAARSAANANVRFTKNGSTAAARNIFRNCVFPAFADASTPYFVDAPDSGGIDRWQLFENCLFINAIGSTASALAGSINCHATAGGLIILRGCTTIGGGEWAAASNANIYIDMPVPDAVGGVAGGEGQPFTT